MRVKEITDALEQLAPLTLQESYDNAGLICGDPTQQVEQVLCSLDCTEDVVEEAIRRGCQMIIAHHPIVFSGLKSITGKNYAERTVLKAIRSDIAIYATHTNLDNVLGGVNAKIGARLGLNDLKILQPKEGLLKKMVTYVPKAHLEAVRQALFEAGAGHIGNYDHCSFSYEGTGTFRGSEGAQPFVGEIGKEHAESEDALEVIFESHLQGRLVLALSKAHPYEEVAYDVYPLSNQHPQIGSGMIGELPQSVPFDSFLRHVAKSMNCPIIRHTEPATKEVRRVAFCGGAGRFLLPRAIASGADVFVTGDFKYHDFFDADGRIAVLDIGHFESEQFTPDLIKEYLEEKFPTFAVLLSEVNTNPVRYFIS